MIKKNLLLFLIIILFGCAYGQDYLDNPKSFIRDPHFTAYHEKRDNLELQYLRKEITYAEYVQQKDALDETYAKEVQERNNKMLSTDTQFPYIPAHDLY